MSEEVAANKIDRVVVPLSIKTPMRNCPDYIDFPTAWAIQRDRGFNLEHKEGCSSVPAYQSLAGPCFLCDCGALKKEWARLRKHLDE